MKKNENLKIPFSIFEKKVEDNTFALLRFLVELVGIKQAKSILNLLSNQTKENIEELDQILMFEIKKLFPSLNNFSDVEIKKQLLYLHEEANEIISNLMKISFEDVETMQKLLNTTIVPEISLAKRFVTFYNGNSSTPRYKYELLRQSIIVLMLLELENHNHTLENISILHTLNNYFEEKLFFGKTGESSKETFFSVHKNEDNLCLKTFTTKNEAQKYISTSYNKNLHIKQHTWNTRKILGFGNVLVDMRKKSNLSILRKAIFKTYLNHMKRKTIDLSKKENLYDLTGFMFVCSDGNRGKLLNEIINHMKQIYPNFCIEEKNTVGIDKNRNQSNKVDFIRVILHLVENKNPIEIIVMDKINYINYQFELEQAHSLFDIRKSTISTNLFFPQKVFQFDPKEVKRKMKNKQRRIKRQLKQKNRVK